MKDFGLQIYTVRDKMTDAESIKTTFKALKEMGYSYIQTAGTPAIPYAEYKAAADEAGIEIVGTHEDYKLMLNCFDAALAVHKTLDTKLMGVGSFHAKPEETDIAVWEEFIKNANAIGKKCAEHGMKFTYHNHSHEFIKLSNGKTIMDMLVEGLDPETTSFVLDTFWVQHGGGDVRYWIEKLAGRIDILHLKDMKRLEIFNEKRGFQMFTEVGNGNLEWDLILDAAEKAGVKYYVVEQDTCPGDSLESARMSAEFLKTKIK